MQNFGIHIYVHDVVLIKSRLNSSCNERVSKRREREGERERRRGEERGRERREREEGERGRERMHGDDHRSVKGCGWESGSVNYEVLLAGIRCVCVCVCVWGGA